MDIDATAFIRMLGNIRKEMMSIDKNDFWEDNYYNHPPLTEEMIKNAESTLKVQKK